MRRAIIDIGSSTICIVVYDIEANDYKEILCEKFYANLIEYKEKNKLSKSGVEQLVYSLSALSDLCKLINCTEADCFATASLRNLENIDNIKKIVMERTGFVIEVLSEEEEAFYAYCCIASNENIPKEGIGFDLGGESCQIFSFNGGMRDFLSIPVGSRSIYKKFVGRNRIIPSRDSISKIRKYVKEILCENGKLKKCGYDTIYAIGGSSRAVLKLYKVMFADKKNKAKASLTLQQLSELIDEIYTKENKSVGIMCHVIPEKIPTIVPSIVAINTICRYTGAKKIYILDSNIRNGYLHSKVTKKIPII